LLWTTLPERFAALGHKVFLDQDVRGRNQETLDLLWKMNPHISGLTDRKPNAGYPLHGAFYDMLNDYPEGANLEVMERVHGLPPPYSTAPKIYYKPKPFHVDLENRVLWDFSALSSTIADNGWLRFMQKMQDRFGRDAEICALTFDSSVGGRRQMPSPIEPTTFHVGSIYQYVDMLASCRAWVGSEAGGQALAAAVRGEHSVWEYDARPEIVSLMTVGTRNSAAFCYRGVNYRSSLFADGDDYLDPVEVPYHRYEQTCKINGKAIFDAWSARR
jgi:hypothetical protein